MSKTLYRTYRPHDFSDVLGQDHITTTLKNAIATNRIGHAYIFTGPRGTGKTTVARIFATAVNTAQKDDQKELAPEVIERLTNGTSMDIIEIDAASHTSVENIRTLRETIALTPTEARYKVYIIDEVHMLSASAFNALLKTLEEPPAHVIFILATTDIHKVPETILSRCQRFDFSRFPIDTIIKKLAFIAQKEKITISDDALEMIAIAANGGMRDAESLLAQVFALENKEITAEEVSLILGTSTPQDILTFIDALCTRDVARALATLSHVSHSGFNLDTFTRSVIEKMRILLYLSLTQRHDDPHIQQIIPIPKKEIAHLQNIAKNITPQTIIMMIEECVLALQKIRSATIEQLPLEIATVRICEKTYDTPSTTTRAHDNQSSSDTQHTSQNKPSDPTYTTSQDTASISKDAQNESVTKTTLQPLPDDIASAWKECITQIDQDHKTLAQLLSQCTAHITDAHTLVICAAYPFYKDKLSEHHNRTIIENTVTHVLKKPFKVTIDVQEKKEDPASSSELLTYATQIMGGVITNS